MRINNEDLLDNGPVDLSLSATLQPLWLGHIVNYSIQLVTSGTAAGTFKLQASNDAGHINASTSTNQSLLTNWTDLGISATISGAGSVLLKDINAGYAWVRVVWTPTSGTGSITSARANVKGV